MKVLVLGIGNPLLHDDGIGPRMIEELKNVVLDPKVTFKVTSLSGINFLDIFEGFDYAVVIDAIQIGGKPGEVYTLVPEDFVHYKTFPSLHSFGLFQALELGRRLEQQIPKKVFLVVISVKDVLNFGEGLSLEVEDAIPVAIQKVLEALGKFDEELRLSHCVEQKES